MTTKTTNEKSLFLSNANPVKKNDGKQKNKSSINVILYCVFIFYYDGILSTMDLIILPRKDAFILPYTYTQRKTLALAHTSEE